jgi:anaerobic magnesium-protoporphyrin IX monomethyl ester cyclase
MALNVGLFKEEIKYPVKKQGNSGDVGIPLGLLYLASYLRDNSETNVKIIDHRLIKAKKQSINLETELQNLDIVGIGACTCEIPKALELLTEAKKHNKITVMGGIYPTLNTAQVLNSGIVDYVILGEGEIAFNSLIKAIELDLPTKGIPGIISAKDFKNGIEYTKAKNVKDLDSLPNPAYDLISLKDYSKFTSAHIYASRGCTQKCEYCTPNKFWGYEHRRRGIENIVSEIKFLKENGFEKINFKDETITLNPIWTEELFTELKRLNLGVKYKIKSRVSDVNEKMLDLLASTGVEEIHMGLESVCQKSLNNMKKNICADIILSVSESILTRGITLNPVFMLSWIGETKEDLKFNTDFIKKL